MRERIYVPAEQSNPFKVGDRFEIARDGEDGYITRVESTPGNSRLITTAPVKYGRVVLLPEGGGYTITRFSERGITRFKVAVEKNFKDGARNFMTLKIGLEGKNTQRRSFFRFSTLLPFKFIIVDDANTGELDGVMLDIGGGGLRFVTNELFEEGNKLKCFLALNGEYLIIISKALERRDIEDPMFLYQYRVVFVDLPPDEQERVVRFIYSEQRKKIATGGKLLNERN
jgi:c-di-GMP-binding flagellar brake protein YcgR